MINVPQDFVAIGDQPHREPPAFPLEIEIEAERTDRPPAAAGLLRIEETERTPPLPCEAVMAKLPEAVSLSSSVFAGDSAAA